MISNSYTYIGYSYVQINDNYAMYNCITITSHIFGKEQPVFFLYLEQDLEGPIE